MGEVYAAYDPGLDRRVALKLVSRRGADSDPLGQERLLREARAIAKLSHPNVVVVYEVGIFREQVFLSMEYIDGTTLAAWLSERPRMAQEILDVFLQAARGLSAAHRAGVVHRDFKPQNVMVSRDGVVRVADFGLARWNGDSGPEAGREGPTDASNAAIGVTLTRPGQRFGTPLFMAPEQLTDDQVDGRTDQFSFCVALYWALFGTHPFGGAGLADPAVAKAPLFAPTTNARMPARIHNAIAKGLNSTPGDRWPSMDALVTALSTSNIARRRRFAAVLVGVMAMFAITLQFAHGRQSFCEGGTARLASAWDNGVSLPGPGSVRTAVHDAILRSGVNESQGLWERVASLMDRHASRWLEAYRDACEATRVRGEQSEEILDLRMSCLNDNLESMKAMTTLLTGGERAVMDHAVEAVGSLDDLSRCEASEQLRSGIRPPKDPALRAAVADLNKLLKEANALRSAGQVERSARIAHLVLTRSEKLDYCPAIAEALLLKGINGEYFGTKDTNPVLERALTVAVSCGHDRIVAQASEALAFFTARDDWLASQTWAELATAAIKRIGGDPLLEAWLANDKGAAYYEQGRWQDALRETQKAISLKERTVGRDNLDVAISLTNLALVLARLRLFDQALEASQRALRIHQRWLNRVGLSASVALANRGEVLFAAGQIDEARAAFKNCLEAIGPSRDNDSLPRMNALRGLGDVALAEGDAGAAVARYREALQMIQKLVGGRLETGELRFRLATALGRMHRTREAISEALEALDDFGTSEGFEPQRREVRAWLSAHHERFKRHVQPTVAIR